MAAVAPAPAAAPAAAPAPAAPAGELRIHLEPVIFITYHFGLLFI